MNIGFIASSGGSVIKEVFYIAQSVNKTVKFLVVTDRPCGVESFCQEKKIHHIRIEEPNNKLFSEKAHCFFKENGGVDLVILFFLRLVDGSIYHNYPTFNLHPSLLPAFKGFNPIQNFINSGAKFFGATLHIVDESIDGGTIVAQVIAPLFSRNEDLLQKVSFLQKTYLVLILLDIIENRKMQVDLENLNISITDDIEYNNFSCPCLSNTTYLKAFNDLQTRESIDIFNL